MSDNWDDFNGPLDRLDSKQAQQPGKQDKGSPSAQVDEQIDDDNQLTGCDWGQSEPALAAQTTVDGRNNKAGGNDLNSAKFIPIYERYLEDKKSILQQTKNYKLYSRNAQKYLRDWFEYEGHEFKVDSDQPSENQYICSIDLPIDEHDFSITSELHSNKKAAIDEICLDACRMLDDCQLLCSNTASCNSANNQDDGEEDEEQDNSVEDLERKRRIIEANKEDDIVFDSTRRDDIKRHCNEANPVTANSKLSSSTSTSCNLKPKVNTYESLMEQWKATNMAILQLKAKLVKLDLSVTGNKPKSANVNDKATTKTTINSRGESYDELNRNDDGDNDGDGDEIDPLDEFMSNLETKTALSMDEKIEKSRLKSQIATYEKEQSKLARLIELAKPSYVRT